MQSVAAAADQVQNEHRRLDVLVNNAGTAEPRVGVADLTADEAMKGSNAAELADAGWNVFSFTTSTHNSHQTGRNRFSDLVPIHRLRCGLCWVFVSV
jgi:short-subunit dehydrogenase involved in D-alanine esterification of teichoic acids